MSRQTTLEPRFSVAVLSRKVRERGVVWALGRALFLAGFFLTMPIPEGWFRAMLRAMLNSPSWWATIKCHLAVKWLCKAQDSPDGALQVTHLVNNLRQPRSANLGGGKFCYLGWENYEEAQSKYNPRSFTFSPCCSLPLLDSSLDTVYTSHTLEHLNTETVRQLLRESFRVLRSRGRFVIKIPDVDEVLDAWRNSRSEFFRDELWGFTSIKRTWQRRGMLDCLDSRAAYIFCGFWNEAFGHLFTGGVQNYEVGYNGPAVVPSDYWRFLATNCTPSQISQALRAFVVENETDFHFNHQNAWSRSELQHLLETTGFRVVSFDKNLIIPACADIPDIAQMEVISTYCLATK
jgi:hypothetical protein